VREVVETVPAEVLETVRGESSDLMGERFYLERYELARPAAPSPGTAQLLLVEAGRRGSLEVETVYARQGSRVWTAPVVELGAAPGDDWGHEIDLPSELGERITVTLRGRDPRSAPPVMLFRRVRVQVQERVRVPLEAVAQRSENGATWIELSRPPGWRIDALEVETSSAAFSRRVTVYDVPLHGADIEVGRTLLSRLGDAAAPEADLISLAPLRGARLRVGIRDADSPPLADLRFFAVVRRPALVFPVRAVRDGHAGTLLFGGGRVRRPHYDLQDIVSGADAASRAEILDAATLQPARLGPAEANPDFEARPVLHFAMHPGAGIDATEYHYRRSLQVPDSPDGLSRLRLGAADLARVRPDLADLRVVDAAQRQWPYLLRRGEAEAWTEVEWRRREAEPGQSREVFVLPTAPLAVPIDRLSLQMGSSYFQRPFELLAYDATGQGHTLLRGTMRSEVDETGPVEIAFSEVRAARLELIIEDGDDAPLRVDAARVRHTVPALFLVAPAGSYELLLGNPEAEPPHYELAGIRDVVFSVAGADAAIGRLATNPDYVPPARRRRGERWWRNGQVLLVWGCLIGAVVALAVLTLRQVRAEPGSDA